MDETVLAILFCIGVLAVSLLAVLLGVIGYFRARRVERELAALRAEVAALRASGGVARAPAQAPHAAEDPLRTALARASERASAAQLPSAPQSPAPTAFDRPSDASLPPKTIPLTGAAPSTAEPASFPPNVAASAAASLPPASATPASVATPSAPRAPADPFVTPAPVAPPKPRVSIEQLVGVKGAAIVGGIILAIAGVALYQVAVAEGWITAQVRLWMGLAFGALCLAGSGPVRKRGYAITGDALAGGGVVILYAAAWAAHQRFGLWPVAVSYGVMIATTVLCAWLALRRSSQFIAVLGLLGGFATPLALSTNSDHPIGLFGYTLLVNLAFLSLAHKRKWPLVGMLGLLGTFVIEALWIFLRMRADTFWIALIVLGVFAVLFVAFTALQPVAVRARWAVTQLGALFLPFLFALYFATNPDLGIGRHLAPIAALSAVILACAGWVARKQDLGFATLGTVAGSIGVVFVWIFRQDLDGDADPHHARAWELAVCCAVLVLVHHVHVELAARARRRAGLDARGLEILSAAILGLGTGVAMLHALAKNEATPFTPWFCALACAALVLARQSALAARPWLTWASALPLGLALWIWTAQTPAVTTPFLHVQPGVWILASSALYLGVEWLRRAAPERGAVAHAQAIVLALGLCALAATMPPAAPELWVAVGEAGLVGLVFALAARRAPSTMWIAVCALLTAFVQGDQLNGYVLPSVTSLDHTWIVLGLLVACGGVAGFVARGWLDSHGVARVRAAAALVWLIPLREVCSSWTSGGWKGLPAALLAGTVAAAWWWTSTSPRATEERATHGFVGRMLQRVFPQRPARVENAPGAETAAFDRPIDTARAWYHAVALSLALAILPLQFDQMWKLVALAFAGAGLVWIAARERRVLFACTGGVFLALATIGSILARAGKPMPTFEHAFANWLVWLYLAPAAAAVFASLRARRLADSLTGQFAGLARGVASTCGIAAIVLVFVWMNLAIRDAFGSSPSLGWARDRMPARDLTLSLSWALYALALLILGVSRRSSGLRWASLILFLLSIGKLFLFDLDHLEGLQRVASLLGLAIALLGVSVLYQKFVFKRGSDTEGAGTPPDAGATPA